MCGFFAVFSLKNNLKNIKKKVREASSYINHRGPDHHGMYVDEDFCINCYRLSIIDLSSDGNQPMISMDNNFVIGFNGEIYNFSELKTVLLSKGYKFRGNSDTEVLLNSFLEWGVECVKKLRGMFSFVIYNKKNKNIFVFRDPLGIKPLYYIYKNSNFIISSEIKPILNLYPEEKIVNEKIVFKYITRGWVDDTEFTFFKNLNSFPAGSYMELNSKNFECENSSVQYFNINKHRKKIKFNPVDFKNKLKETISYHLIADAPLAFTLSGGLDSSTITAFSSVLSENSSKIKAFTVLPPDTNDESSWVNDIVSYLGIEHEYIDTDVANIFEVFDRVIDAQDEPFLSSNVLYQFILRKKISEYGYKVILVGEGADELLGGYKRFVNPYLSTLKKENADDIFKDNVEKFTVFLNKSKSDIMNSLSEYEKMVCLNHHGQENMSAYNLIDSEFYQKFNNLLNVPSYPKKDNKHENRFFSHIFYHLTERDLPYVLRMEDRNSMFNNIEARVPFLDIDLIDFILSHDFKEFMKTGFNKSMLRNSLDGILPESVINRKDKSPRPGNNVHFVYKLFKPQIKKLINSDIFAKFKWFTNDLILNYENDAITLNEQRAEFWFRFYSLGRWLELKINN